MGMYQTERRNKNRGCMSLIVWQKAMDLFEWVWKMTGVDATIDFKLHAQITDAAQSVAANISEGYARRLLKEYIEFLYHAAGSMGKTMTRAVGLTQTNQLSQEQFHGCDLLRCEVENRLLRLIEKFRQKSDN